jgi:hypothetical protein
VRFHPKQTIGERGHPRERHVIGPHICWLLEQVSSSRGVEVHTSSKHQHCCWHHQTTSTVPFPWHIDGSSS